MPVCLFWGKMETHEGRSGADFQSAHRYFQSAINLPVWDNKIQADICGIYLFRNIDYDPNIDADEKRRDHEFHINMQLYGNITSKLMFNIGYFKTFNDSNTTNDQRIDPYHFQRAVYSVQFIYSF